MGEQRHEGEGYPVYKGKGFPNFLSGLMRLPLLLLTALLFFASPETARAQLLVDTLYTWKGFSRTAQARVRLYAGLPDEDRSHIFVLQEMADNRGPTTVDDARLLADLVGREFGIEPGEAYFLFHWGGFSFEGADPDDGKELFLRATFKRNKSGILGSPLWRVVSREEVEELTDRQFH